MFPRLCHHFKKSYKQIRVRLEALSPNIVNREWTRALKTVVLGILPFPPSFVEKSQGFCFQKQNELQFRDHSDFYIHSQSD